MVASMDKETKADKVVREAAAEFRRETRAAAQEVRLELDSAKRETRQALRGAMREVRAAFADLWDEGASDAASSPASGRMSRAQRKEMTRELLLDAAIDVFAEKGYHGASLDDVAEAAGFTKGAVYSNFARKSDLFRALLERESVRAEKTRVQTVETVPLELLPNVAGELLREPETDPQGQTVLVEFWLAAVRDPDLRAPLAASRERLAVAFEAKLDASGVHTGLSGTELAAIFEALVTGLTMDRLLQPDGAQPLVLTKALRKLLADERVGTGA